MSSSQPAGDGKGLRRTFAAALPTPAGRRRLAGLCALLAELPDCRAVPPENLHVTLRFYGDSDPGQVAAQGERIAAAAGLQSFSARIGRACWMPRRDGRMLWLELAACTPLTRLRRRQFDSPERLPRFRPHITLLRGQPAALPRTFVDAVERVGKIEIESVALIASQLLPDGARYRIIRRVRLDASVGRGKEAGSEPGCGGQSGTRIRRSLYSA